MDVCLLLDEPALPRWQADALAALLEDCDATVTTVVYDETNRTRTYRETVRRALELREWAVVGAVEEVLSRPDSWTEPVALEDVVSRDPVTELSTTPTTVDGWKQRIPERPVERAAAEADVAVRLGFGFIVGPVLSAFEHGVLSYHHGDLREYRGKPMGFWEFLHGNETAGITVQQLTDELDAGRIAALETVPIDDLQTWQSVRRRLYARSDDVLARAVRNVQRGDLREPSELGEVYTHPSGLSVLKYVLKNTRGRARSALTNATS